MTAARLTIPVSKELYIDLQRNSMTSHIQNSRVANTTLFTLIGLAEPDQPQNERSMIVQLFGNKWLSLHAASVSYPGSDSSLCL